MNSRFALEGGSRAGRHNAGFWLSITMSALLVACLGNSASAQLRRPGQGEPVRKRPVLRIRRIDGMGSGDRQFTPRYETSARGGREPAKEWGVVTLEYSTEPEWIDNVTITFYALSMMREGKQNIYSMYRKEVNYVDVEEDNDHRAAAYLRPAALERYGRLVAIAAEVSVDGEPVAEIGDKRLGDALPEKWWKDPRVVKSELVTMREGYLLSKKESPFALIAVDDYEWIR